MVKKFLAIVMFVIMVGFGAALTLKAAIGVGAWDAKVATIASIMNVQIGTMVIVANSFMVLVQILILRKGFKKLQLLQVLATFIMGNIINFVLYTLLVDFEINNYFMRLAVYLGGIVLIAFAVGAVMTINLIPFPVEGACQAMSKKTGLKFAFLRQMLDVVAVLSTIALTFIFSQNLIIREGTIIGVLIFGPLMGFFMKQLAPLFVKLRLVHEDKEENEQEELLENA